MENRKIKIFGYGWHTAHQHDLLKIPNTEWFYIKNRIKPAWTIANRPYPKNLSEVDHYEPGKYDLAVLHVDQQCLFGHPKGIPYRELDKKIQDIPKIVINHGTPHYQEYPSEFIAARMRELIGSNTMVVNSFEAREEWGFGEAIIHGMDDNEFSSDKFREVKRRVVTVMSPGNPNGQHDLDGWAEYYGRRMYDEIKKRLSDLGVEVVHIGKDITFQSFEEYRKYLSESLIYLNPTRHSPMPRSRTEAMFSRCCVVTTPYHGAGKIFKHGENGFLFETADEAVSIVMEIIDDQKRAFKIGCEGIEAARKLFSYERYHGEWMNLIEKTIHEFVYSTESRTLRKRIKELAEMMWLAGQSGRDMSRVSIDALVDDVIISHENRLISRNLPRRGRFE